MEEIRELLRKKEAEGSNNAEDVEKINFLKDFLKQDNIFFKIDYDTAYGILKFLGIPEDQIENKYYQLISAENYLKYNKQYYTISKDM